MYQMKNMRTFSNQKWAVQWTSTMRVEESLIIEIQIRASGDVAQLFK